jgi:hypothetical protein
VDGHFRGVTFGEAAADQVGPGAEVHDAGFGFETAAFDKVGAVLQMFPGFGDQVGRRLGVEHGAGDRGLPVNFGAEQSTGDVESYGVCGCRRLGAA